MRATIDGARRAGFLLVLLATAFAAAVLAAPAGAQSGTPIRDPIPEQPVQSGIGLQLTEFTRLPRSNTYPGPPVDGRLVRWNRINYLGEVPDGSGRFYVPDLNGKLYIDRERDAARVPRRRRHVRAGVLLPARPRAGLRLRRRSTRTSRENGRFYTVHTEQASLADAAARLHAADRPRSTAS